MKKFFRFFIVCLFSIILINFQDSNNSSELENNVIAQNNNISDEPLNSDLFWSENIGDKKFIWNNEDFYIKSSKQEIKVFSTLAFNKYKVDKREQPKYISCLYSYDYYLKSVVGNSIGLMTEYMTICGIVSSEIHFRTVIIDNNKPKIASLLDYFSEDEVFSALKNNEKLYQAVIKDNNSFPSNLSKFRDYLSKRKTPMFKFFYLESDFLSKFVFYEIKDDKVIVKISLYAYKTGIDELETLDLELPISNNQRTQFLIKKDEPKFFLMKDKNFNEEMVTSFEFKVEKSKKNDLNR